MATFVLIHGGGSTAWDWHRVSPLFESAGHHVVAVDLPIEDARSGLEEYVSVVTAAVGDRRDVIVVGHSLGGFTAPLVRDALQAEGLVYLAGMIPSPGEAFVDWWTNTGHHLEDVDADPAVTFFDDVPAALADGARSRGRDQKGEWMSSPWPGERHHPATTRAILATGDRFFPAPFMRRHISDRLGIEPIEIPGGHYAPLSQPNAVAAALLHFAGEITAQRDA
ncbi:Alpha/beta hydrolase family protein [Nocardioides alpinus]|uniref:Alpha/beta hydrolase n=1 Tax=Nocardioides alpinus TaxID=748909 RepID=A0A1I1B8W1_9ACTN|nr:alpha/beta hydrolase [Nocardioides alpinus]PKH41275.1 alpha/beta hydrolase [Nocardioides alpinus]SFB46212.1 Alpha/beta hydrolase family protein [Nocardioides alpinus]